MPRSLSRKLAVALVTACVLLAVPLASIALSLLVSPPQAIQTAGQSLELSAGPPTLTADGPGTLALFGEKWSSRSWSPRPWHAADIAAVNGTTVVNLACTNASIESGLFGIESINGSIVPAQLATLDGMTGVRTVIVSIVANEMHWAALMKLCLVSPQCDDSASSAWFAQALDGFAVDYYDLLQHLATLPGAPQVIVNEYYDPLPVKPACPGHPDLTVAKSAVLLARLTTFNAVLSEGAASFGFAAVDPSFAGHELCTNQSFVQGLGAGAPLHPNAAGELAIALADERPLLNPAPPHPTEDPTPSPTP